MGSEHSLNMLGPCETYGLGVKVFLRFAGRGLVSLLIKYKGVCKTVPAKMGLLNLNITGISNWSTPIYFSIFTHLAIYH